MNAYFNHDRFLYSVFNIRGKYKELTFYDRTPTFEIRADLFYFLYLFKLSILGCFDLNGDLFSEIVCKN